MSIMMKVMETMAKLTPDKEADPLIEHKSYVGRAISRVDGQLKVTGEASFSAEYKLGNVAHATVVYSTIAKGRISGMNTTRARNQPGILAVITHENMPRLKHPDKFSPGGKGKYAAASDLPVLHGEKIHWNGEPVALVIAETLEQAEWAASLVQVTYIEETGDLSFDGLKESAKTPKDILNEPAELKIGDAEKALQKAPHQVDQTYRTPRYNHNAIEPHASIAWWKEEDKLIVYDASQHINGVKNTLAEIFSLKPEQVQVLAPFVGGGFGGKGSMWTNTMLCAIAAKVTGRPVKLALSREGVFRSVGGRTPSEQRVALGAGDDAKFVSIIHSGTTATTTHNDFPEQFSFPVRHLYASQNFWIGQKVLYLDTVANTFMRAPGESIGTFALESAVDELAHKINIDPVELRRINEPEKDPIKENKFSSRHLVEAYRRGAEKFGWKWSAPRSKRDGKWLIGHGVASAFYPVYRQPANARVCIYADGTALVQAAAHEMGMGTATAQLQHAADRLGLPIEKVSFSYGDTDLPEAAYAGGSNQTVSVAAAVMAATDKLLKEFLSLAAHSKGSPLANAKLEEVQARGSGIFLQSNAAAGETYAAILQRAGKDQLEAEAAAAPPLEIMKYSMNSYGAHFTEVRVHEDTGELRISRWVGSFDTGTIVNPQTAVSQFRGGIIMGIGMALTEETFFDERRGRIANPSLAEYHVPVHADVPHIDVIYNDIPDPHTPMGAHGIGEIGITGTAAAIANAVFNATGKRIRQLPITLDKLMS